MRSGVYGSVQANILSSCFGDGWVGKYIDMLFVTIYVSAEECGGGLMLQIKFLEDLCIVSCEDWSL